MSKFLTFAIILIAACSALSADYGVAKFVNPICGGADPCVVKNPVGPGYWYVYTSHTAVFAEYALTPTDFEYSRKNEIFSANEGTEYEKEFWAPELIRFGDKWYIYFTAVGKSGIHQLFVISGDDPMKPFGDVKCLGSHNNDLSIDQSVFEYKGKLYTVYSSGHGSTHQDLYIDEMESPTKIKGSEVFLTGPELEWERRGWNVTEGPVALQRNGKLYIVYSASGAAFDEYCLGILKFKGGKVTDPANWEKHPGPIMTGRGNLLGTGHCTFTKDADGNDWCAFHINKPRTAEQYGNWVPRFLCLQPVIWIDDFPHFSPMVEKPKYFKYEK